MIVVWLPGWDIHLDSPNKVRGKHWSRSQRRAKDAKVHVLVALNELERVRGKPQALPWVRSPVMISAVNRMKPRQRALDGVDNARAALKPIIDALVHHQVIEADRPSVLLDAHLVEIPHSVHGGTPGLEITVRPA